MTQTTTFPTPDMQHASSPSDMADAFHPSAFPGDVPYHVSPVLETVEAALLFAAGRISRYDFLDVVQSNLGLEQDAS